MKTDGLPPPRVEGAPGLTWRPRANGKWEARWQCRTDIATKGYPDKTVRLGVYNHELTKGDIAFISDCCRRMQDDMLTWSHGGSELEVGGYDGSLRGLISAYQLDPDSRFHKIRYATRKNYTVQCRLLLKSVPDGTMIEDIKPRTVLRWYEEWCKRGVARAHCLITMTRLLLSYGATLLECKTCLQANTLLSELKFKSIKPREEVLTAEQAIAIRARAHQTKHAAIALAQAFQFECTLRQKDVIGEWVPMGEPELSNVLDQTFGMKWLRGIQWQEIDDNLVLRHTTSKRQKEIEINLRLAPMVMEELRLLTGRDDFERSDLPAAGPIVLNPAGRPYRNYIFRRHWRKIADAVGISKSIKNMDTRAGAITEATDSGASLEDVRHAATHSNIAMTQRYSREQAKKTANVMELRARNRNKSGTGTER